jgi:glycosyltransferase involved in cell wall biosynthesis
MARPYILMVGPFPPPVHGMGTTNAAVRDSLRDMGGEPIIINIGPSSLDRRLVARFSRVPRVLVGLIRLIAMRDLRGKTLYISASGGFGQLYELLFIGVARLLDMRIFIRHCSFAYLDSFSVLARVLADVAGPDSVHITQSHGMAEKLIERYGVKCVIPISNAVLYLQEQTTNSASRQQLKTLGFLSNISAEKGIYEFLDLMEAIQVRGLPVKAVLAGPFQDLQTERTVRERLNRLENVEYVGSVYGERKEGFLAGIDALIFPTRYKNETEAKVNHEAMSHGVPVIAYGRGCIPEIIGADCGCVIDPGVPFVEQALDQISVWVNEPAVFEAASSGAAARFAKTYSESMLRWKCLLNDLVGIKNAGESTANRTEKL